MSAEMFELDCLPLCGSPPRSAPLTTFYSAASGSAAAAIFGEVVGGCGHTFVQDAGKETFKWSSLSLSLSISPSLSRLVTFSFSSLYMFTPTVHVHMHANVLPLYICMYSISICKRERERVCVCVCVCV